MYSQYVLHSLFQFTSDSPKGLVTMNTATPNDFDFSFLEEGFSARDIVDQKINESSMTVSVLCCHCSGDTQMATFFFFFFFVR